MSPAGQPKLDLAVRAKNWLWYWLVKCLSNLSDDDLDGLFAGSAGAGKRPRTFYRIRRLGSSPTDRRGYRKSSRSVFEAIHGDDHDDRSQYEEARLLFESKLWELLTNQSLSNSTIREIANTIIATRGLTRISADEAALLRDVVNDHRVLKALGHTRTDKEALELFRDSADIESITLLCCLYKFAIAFHQLERAIALRDAVERSLILFLHKWHPPKFLASLLNRLVSDRILGNSWLSETDWGKSIGIDPVGTKPHGSEAKRRREIHAFVHWYVYSLRDGDHGLTEDAGLPIPITPVLQWTRERADTLKAVRLAANSHRGEAAYLEDSTHPNDIERLNAINAQSSHLKSSLTRFLQGLLDTSKDSTAPAAIESALGNVPTRPISVPELLARIDEENLAATKRARAAHRKAHRQAMERAAKPAHAPPKPAQDG